MSDDSTTTNGAIVWMRDWDRRLAAKAPAPAAAPIIIREAVADPPPPKPWRFTPRRDENGLIIEIIAEPIEGPK